MKYENSKQDKYKNLSCPKCNSLDIVKRGSFETKAHGKQQRYFCKNCQKKFIIRGAFYHMKNSAEKITLCLDLFYRGISLRQIQAHLKAFYPHNSDYTTIYDWIIKYSKMISNFTEKIKVNPIRELQIDEVEIGSRKSRYNGWFVDSIDTETRYMVASQFGKSRDEKAIKGVIKKAKDKAGNISIYTTDGFTTYENVIKSVAGYYNIQKGYARHNKVTQLKNEGFNHKIERMHNSIRHRIKTFRGLHSIIPSNDLMQGYQIYYNFIRVHQAIKKCPYELATELKLTSNNKWLELIRLSQAKLE